MISAADTTTSNRATALAALTLGGLGAYFISQLGTGSPFPQYATGFPIYWLLLISVNDNIYCTFDRVVTSVLNEIQILDIFL